MKVKPPRFFLGVVKRQKIQLETLLRISQHGDGAYLFIPKDIIDCYRLLAGDRVKVQLVESFRLISGVEKEEADKTREAKIEPILVIPKQRRRRRKPDLDSDTEFEASSPTSSCLAVKDTRLQAAKPTYVYKHVKPAEPCGLCGQLAVEWEITTPQNEKIRRCNRCFVEFRKAMSNAVWKEEDS